MSRFAVLIAVLVCSVALVAAAPIHRLPRDTPIPYTNCGSSSDLLTLTAVTANAWPPVKGADMTITAQGTLSLGVSAGSYEIKATYLGITILDQKGPLSDLVTLPLAAGPVSISKTENLPSITPSGTINIQITANDDQGHELTCLKIVANIKSDLPALVGDTPIPYTNCGTSSDLLTLTAVTANAWPPVKGADMTITAQGTLSLGVSAGSYEIQATFLGITILDQKGPLSDLVTLPLAAGPVSISKTENLPSITPSGTINIQITANDDQGHELTCLKIVANIKAEEPVVILPHREYPTLRRFGDVNVPYTDCASDTLMPVTGIVASSWPPVSGSSITLQTSFNAKEEVTGGEYNAKVEYFGIILQDNTKSLADAGFQLPIKVGSFTLTQTLDVPTGLPSGEITEIISAKDAAGNKLFCVNIAFKV